MWNRRRSLVALAAGLHSAPWLARAQQQRIWRVGLLVTGRRPEVFAGDMFGGFPRGMRELGYVEGTNYDMEWRFADGQYDRLPAWAAELVQLKVDVIVSGGSPAVGAAQKATTAIPIVMTTVADPVGAGFVSSLARPGGNITGLTNIAHDLGGKCLELLRGILPSLSRVAVLANPTNPATPTMVSAIQAAASSIRIVPVIIEARTGQELEGAFARMARENLQSVVILPDGVFIQQASRLAALASSSRLPTITGFSAYAEVGGLMSFSANFTDIYRRAATYVDKIFKGARPSELPVEQPTTFELFINANAARALGLLIPPALLVRADKVIQ